MQHPRKPQTFGHAGIAAITIVGATSGTRILLTAGQVKQLILALVAGIRRQGRSANRIPEDEIVQMLGIILDQASLDRPAPPPRRRRPKGPPKPRPKGQLTPKQHDRLATKIVRSLTHTETP